MRGAKRPGNAAACVGGTLLCLLLGVVIALGGAIGVSYFQNRSFKETFYEISSSKVEDRLRIIQISDLHEAKYENLVKRVQTLAPDLIVFTGDLVSYDTVDETAVVELCGQLAEIAPAFYVYGNHERRRQYGSSLGKEEIKALAAEKGVPDDGFDFRLVEDDLRDQMEAVGVSVLHNEQATVQVGDTAVDIFGVLTATFDGFYRCAEEQFYDYAYEDYEHFKLMLLHEPYLTDWIEEEWGDLILCGHTHGGMVRIPLLGGLFEDNYGVFPEFLNDGKILGLYSVGDIPLIVSSGMANRDLLRINNKPELVVVDINHY